MNSFSGSRVSPVQAIELYNNLSLAELGQIANERNQSVNSGKVFFNKNIHIEPTNICVNHCLFCSYRRKKNEPQSWEYSVEQMLDFARQSIDKEPNLSEFHIVGGVHPDRGLRFYTELVKELHNEFPKIHIKAFTAEEIAQMCRIEGVDIIDGLRQLKSVGLMSMPGGGAEIFNPKIRRKICPDKITGDVWLNIHKLAHSIDIPTNATMLYGHYDKIEERIEHLNLIRDLQDITHGFNAFIPLKFMAKNNKMSHLGEVDLIEDIKTFAITRIFLDNIPNIKAYWPMLGVDEASLLLEFGVNDLDGTIDDSTKIYSMAGANHAQTMSSKQLVDIIKRSGKVPIERDSLYNTINEF